MLSFQLGSRYLIMGYTPLVLPTGMMMHIYAIHGLTSHVWLGNIRSIGRQKCASGYQLESGWVSRAMMWVSPPSSMLRILIGTTLPPCAIRFHLCTRQGVRRRMHQEGTAA